MTLSELFAETVARRGSDLHLVVGEPPVFRIDGSLIRAEQPALTDDSLNALLAPYLDEDAHERYRLEQSLNVTIRQDGLTFRLHCFQEQGHPAATIRLALQEPPALDVLRLRPGVQATLKSLLQMPRGLIVVTGASGSGKGTLCAALLEEINRTRGARILTLENPTEYEIVSKKSLITRRNVGRDVPSYESGLAAAWDEDPDIIYLAELRTLEAGHMALMLAEAGHLVIVTLHVESTSEAVKRLVDSFPEPRDTIQRMVSRNLLAAIAQQLVPRREGGRVPAHEILRNTPRMRGLIASGMEDLTLALEAGRGEGMQTMDDALLELYHDGEIVYETAWERISDYQRLGPKTDVASEQSPETSD